MGRLGLLVGNGPYAVELVERLRDTHRPLVVSLLPRLLSKMDRLDHYASPSKLSDLIGLLSSQEVDSVVLGGDLGLFNMKEIFHDLLFSGGVVNSMMFEYAQKNLFRLGVISYLQFVKTKLIQNNVIPRIASELLPSLRPDCGLIVQGRAELGVSEIRKLVTEATRESKTQPAFRVRQAVVFENGSVCGVERESTDALLRRVGERKKPEGSVRYLLKICPARISPTIDAPVIGPDTIAHCIEAEVDAIIFDCVNGIIADRATTESAAKEAGITIVGARAAA